MIHSAPVCTFDKEEGEEGGRVGKGGIPSTITMLFFIVKGRAEAIGEVGERKRERERERERASERAPMDSRAEQSSERYSQMLWKYPMAKQRVQSLTIQVTMFAKFS